MGEARAHHFISQCYLKGFTPNGSKKSKLHVVSIDELKTFETKPENVAHRRDFNRIEGLPAGALEAHLGKFETQVDRALRTIGADRSLDDTDAWHHVLNLAALFAVRHPLQRENVRQFMERTSKIIMDLALATPERWASQLRQARASGAISSDLEVPYETLREFHQRGEYTVEVPTARHIDLEFKTHDTVLRTLGDRQWTLCIVEPGAGHFVTSDNPLVLVHSDGTPPSLMSHRRDVAGFDRWLKRASSCSVPEMRRFAASLRANLSAVGAAFVSPWSSGQVEGQINRLKFLKRRMYGRAKLDLLRVWVLHRVERRRQSFAERPSFLMRDPRWLPVQTGNAQIRSSLVKRW